MGAPATEHRRAVGYVRVSTAEQAHSGLGLDAQRRALEEGARHLDLELVDVLVDAGVSGGARVRRPALERAVELLEARDGPRVLLVAKVDRVGRSIVTWGRLLGRAMVGGWELLALDAPDRGTEGDLLRNVLASMAEFEGRRISRRTTEALAAARARGVRLGPPQLVTPEVVARIVATHAGGASPASIAAELTADGVSSPAGRPLWRPSQVRRVLTAAGVPPGRPGRPVRPRKGALRRRTG